VTASPSRRPASERATLVRLGFVDTARAARLLADPALAPIRDDAEMLQAIADGADPDQALLGLLRILEAAPEADALVSALERDTVMRRRLLAVLGLSAPLGDHLARHPQQWRELAALPVPAPRVTPEHVRAALLTAVQADPDAATPVATLTGAAARDALRVAYRQQLLLLAARDLADSLDVGIVAGELADLAAAALETALAVARAEHPEASSVARLAVVAMGKCGGRELNYVSDVDVMFVAAPVADEPEDAAIVAATALATTLMRVCSEHTAEGTLWPVDAALRPEGKAGPLVRTLDSYLGYYDRWAKTWEFQALLKARPVAGDVALGADFARAVQPAIWAAAERDGFVEDVRAMRRRVEEHVPLKDADRQVKLGRGGLRDVEFAVQLLQLVHGRGDDTLRVASTLGALAALTAGGYVGREDGTELAASYRWLRTLEHRMQLVRLRRTQVLPRAEADVRRLGRSLGFRHEPAAALERTWRRHQRTVRRLHEKLFYRPLLEAVARVPGEATRLTPEAARARLQALGYRDPAGALRHLEALTAGVSRRAAIQRALLPVLLGWFADGVDPDAGLAGFREVSDSLGDTHWYLRLLRDERAAAERMARVLSSSVFATGLLRRAPDGVAVLGGDDALILRDRPALGSEVLAGVQRHTEPVEAIGVARAMRRRELFRIAVAELESWAEAGPGAPDETAPVDAVAAAVTAVAEATVTAAYTAALRQVAIEHRGLLPTRFAVVAMGRLGGRELAYGSDADVVFVHDPVPGADPDTAARTALAIAQQMRRLLSLPGPEPPLTLDADLRPEGRNGPLVRTLASYAAYYQRWGEVWERQALLRAAPLCGDAELLADFAGMVAPLRWSPDGVSAADLLQVRRIKARVESERLPRGANPALHLKLGPGGLADVEWTVQLLQLQHAGVVESLRTTSTLQGLQAAVEAELLSRSEGDALVRSWLLASRIRNAIMHVTGRSGDEIPADPLVRASLAGLLRVSEGPDALVDGYRRSARRARRVVEQRFYGET
jgi:glutamate-ammonia-ligase adenylyltransferase